MKRFALIHEDRVRPETTGLYCLRAFSRLGTAVHFQPEEIENISSDDFDLFIRVDDGLHHEVRADLHPMIYWAIDTHVGFQRCLEAARAADFVFAAQRDGVELFRQTGIHAWWLPLACDPEIHRRQPETKRLDLCFVGNVLPGVREERLRDLTRHFPSLYIGKHYFQDMARVYSQSKIVFNQSIASDLNMRVFEALASGSLLVTDDLTCNGMRELFEPGRHLVTFRDAAEMISKVRYYLDHEADRERIAASGRETAIADHTYDHRIRTMLGVVESRPKSFAVSPSPGDRKDRSYFEHSRPELLELIPMETERLLDVGCGAGVLGDAVKRRQSARVIGIERDSQAARLARQRLDGVLEVDIESPGWDFESHAFDCIVCGDILEHLIDPVGFLGRARSWLTPEGTLVLSVPNVRHHSVVRSLLDGNFTYEPAGLLDHDHVQCFTRRRLEQLLSLAGFEAEIVRASLLPGDESRFQEVVDGSLSVGELRLEGLDGQSSQEFFVYQFLVRARRNPDATPRATMCDQLQTIEDCVTVEPNYGVAMVPDLGKLRDPAKWLRSLHAQLRDGEKVRFAFKTCRHQKVLSRLLMGDWDQPLNGDEGQAIRFFTRREVEKLLFRTGYDMESFQPVPTSEWSQWLAAGRPLEISQDGLCLKARSADDAEEFHVTTYNVTASKTAPRAERLTSIVIVTHNQWDYTRQCLDSIRFRTDESIEIIVVDNGSTDATVDCLRQRGDVTLIENASNLGFPKGANQGIAAAQGDFVLLLNNDVIVTTGWLRRLLDAMEREPGLGLVGPCSNNVSGEQCVPVEYDDLSCLDGWAWQWSKQHADARTLTDRLVGFCLMIRREVLRSIGGLDERFGIGCFEDDDLCRRAMEAGYKAAIVWDSFVHHFGSRTFFGSGVDFAGILEQNRQKYLEKWGPAKPVDSLVGADGSLDSPSEPESIKRRPTLSLCMIARNNQGTIGPALESIRPWVDEMIVVDTGSVDRTREMARALGARVFEFPWCDDFSAARNCSLDHAGGDWILWMDSDDVIDEENGRRLRELLDAPNDPSLWGYVLQVHCPAGDGELDATVVDHVKLFRNRKGIHFERRIHEQVLPSIRRGGGEVAWTDLFLVHKHSDRTPEGREKKLERDFRILKLDLLERPDHPFVLFNLGMTHADASQHEEAIEVLTRCLEVSDVEQSHVRKAYSILAGAHVERREFERALSVCQRGRTHFPLDVELLFREAMLQHHFGRLEEAEALYRRVLEEEEERHFTSVDRGLARHKARHNLARVHEDQGDLAAAESEWRNLCQQVPEYIPGWQGLGDVLIRQGKLEEAILEAASWRENLQAPAAVQREGYLLGSKTALAIGNYVEAERLLADAVQRFPEDPEPLRAWCRFLFEHADPQFALPALNELARREPEDASTYHNLGAVYLRLGDADKAVESFQRSLVLRPHSPITSLHLGYALRETGANDQAVDTWTKALHAAPENEQLRSALAETSA